MFSVYFRVQHGICLQTFLQSAIKMSCRHNQLQLMYIQQWLNCAKPIPTQLCLNSFYFILGRNVKFIFSEVFTRIFNLLIAKHQRSCACSIHNFSQQKLVSV